MFEGMSDDEDDFQSVSPCGSCSSSDIRRSDNPEVMRSYLCF